MENRNDFIISAFATLWGPRCPLSSFLLLREKSEKQLKYIRKGDSENIRKELTRKNRTEKSGRSYASKHRKNARAKPATAGEKTKRTHRVARLSNAQAWATHVHGKRHLRRAVQRDRNWRGSRCKRQIPPERREPRRRGGWSARNWLSSQNFCIGTLDAARNHSVPAHNFCGWLQAQRNSSARS